MRFHVYVFLLLSCSAITVSMGKTPPPVVLTDTTRFVAVDRRVAVLEDKTARLTFDQVRQRTDFVPNSTDRFQFGFSSSAYWFRFEVTNRNLENQKHWLVGLLDATSIDYVDAYIVYPDGRVEHRQGGLRRPYVDQGFWATTPFFRVTLPVDQPVAVYFRIESSLSMFGKVTVWDEYYNLSKGRVVVFIVWMFLGLFILRSLNSFVLARFIPDPQFRFYAICTFLLYLSTLSRTGIYPLVLSNFPALLDWMNTGMGRLLPLGMAAWMYTLFAGRPAFRILRMVFLAIVGVCLVGTFLSFFVQNASIGKFYALVVLVTYLLFTFGVGLIWASGKRPTLHFVLPIALCTIPFSLYQLQALNVTPYMPVVSYLALLALAVEMVSMSLVLGRIVQSYIQDRIATANALMQEKVEVDKLQELSTLKTRFFTNISHEFRTPLTLIVSPLSELKKRFPQEPLLNLIERNANQLLSLINQLLDVSRLESVSTKAELRPGDMALFLRTIASSFESLAGSRQVRFFFTQSTPERMASFDPDKLGKIVNNLLSNALKFTPPGRDVRMEVLYTDEPDTSQVRIRVQDTGIGIASAHLPHIFERFYQVASHSEHTYAGTGVGLSLVRELVDILDGTIDVNSVEGLGTLFTVTLPLIPSPVSVIDGSVPASFVPPSLPVDSWPTPTPAVSDVKTQPVASDPILLIIDDNPDIRTYLTHVFAADYRIIEAVDGQAGLEKAMATLPDLIICDLMMPRLDGFAFCQTMKTEPVTSHIPIVMLTALGTQENRIQGLELGADVYLSKPFDPNELSIQVRNLLQKQALMRQYLSQDTRADKQPVSPKTQREAAFLRKVQDVIDAHIAQPGFTVEALCQAMNMSQSQLVRKLRALTGQTAVEFLRNHRLSRAAERLEQGGCTVSEAAYGVGFESLSYFTRVFQDKYGVNPSTYSTRSSP